MQWSDVKKPRIEYGDDYGTGQTMSWARERLPQEGKGRAAVYSSDPTLQKQVCVCEMRVSCELLIQMLGWLRNVFTGQSVGNRNRNVEESPHCVHVRLLGESREGNGDLSSS